jgi:hypothetical protein
MHNFIVAGSGNRSTITRDLGLEPADFTTQSAFPRMDWRRCNVLPFARCGLRCRTLCVRSGIEESFPFVIVFCFYFYLGRKPIRQAKPQGLLIEELG